MDLARTCFDALWGTKEHRHWLIWRLPILVVEEALYLVGELTAFLDQKSRDEMDWRRFYYRVVLADAARDALGLRIIYNDHGIPDATHPELETLRCYDLEDPNTVAAELLHDMGVEHKVTEYMAPAMGFLAGRAQWSGRLEDRQTLLAAMVILAHRGLTKEEALDISEIGVQRYLNSNGGGKPRTVSLPWYVFDQDTRVGAVALKAFMKKHKVDKERLRRLWYYAGSQFVPAKMANWCKALKNEPRIWESMWWPMAVRVGLTFKGRDPKANYRIWANQVRPEMQQVVEWALETRQDK